METERDEPKTREAHVTLFSLLLIWALVGLVVLVPVALFIFAYASRNRFRCDKCGEVLVTEYLNAERCGMCGAALRREEY